MVKNGRWSTNFKFKIRKIDIIMNRTKETNLDLVIIYTQTPYLLKVAVV